MEQIKEIIKMAVHPGRWGELFKKYREIIMYVIFGALTTLVSIVTYFAARMLFPNEGAVPEFLKWTYRLTLGEGDSSTVLPNIISWIVSVTFAYITNRIWVFKSKVKGVGKIALQALSFYAARLLTLFVDLIIMYLLVNLPAIENGLYEFCVKVFSNIVVLVLNYVFSKVFIFRKSKADAEKQDS